MADQFDRCWPWLERAIARGRDAEMSRPELLRRLLSNQAQLWPGEMAVMVTSLHITPEGRCIHVWLAGGDLGELLQLRPGVEAWGRAQGCEFASIDGRPGWERALKPYGFVRVGEELIKHL